MPLMKEAVIEGIKKLRELNTKKKFVQTVDIQVSLKETDLKKPENKIKELLVLPHAIGKKVKVAIFVDKELVDDAKKVFDEVIMKDNFNDYTKKKDLRRLVKNYKYFVAQANLMGEVAQYFGKTLGPKSKMPDPKAGCVIPPKKELLKPVYDKLQKSVMVKVKDLPSISTIVGIETMKDEELADNVIAVYNLIKTKLPRGEEQIAHAYIKMTMSGSVKL